jgi:ATP-binding cassette subfamily B protein
MVAGVRQDPQLFTETIRFNVDLGNRGISEEQNDSAAQVVHADRVVERVGWGHLLRERGADLSVGEGQLLTFARAMAHDTSVVILDEATASIDTVTEQLIQDALSRIFERKTVIVVAHRLSTVEKADRIVVMDMGEIVEQGSHDELMARDGRYAHLVRAGEDLLVA